MAEQSACASVVAAARADEEAARRGSGTGSSTFVAHEETERGPDGSTVHRTIQQGESLLLPLLVEQLRSSLRVGGAGDAPVAAHAARGRAPAHAPVPAPPHGPGPGPGVAPGPADDSGTESGDDLRLLAAGLRDSIELQRHQQAQLQQLQGPAPAPPAAAAAAAAPAGLLCEVQAALARLQASLQQGGELAEVALDADRRDALLLLVSRLQASLSLPPAGPPAPAAPLAKASPELVECPPAHSRRFANRRQRHNRHTVGVTREELADARRWLEEQSLSGSASPGAATPSAGAAAPAASASSPAPSARGSGGLASPARQYSLLKQSSAGELRGEGAAPADALTPAQRAFRPVRFVPGRSKSATQDKERDPAHSSPAAFEQANDEPPPASEVRVRPTGATGSDSVSSGTVNGAATDRFPSAGQNVSVQETAAQTKVSDPANPKHHYTPESYQGVVNVPMAAVMSKEYRPGKPGNDVHRPRNKSLSQSSSVESSQSKSSASTDSRSVASDHFQQSLSHSSSCESTSNSKVSTPQRSDSSNLVQLSNQQQWDGTASSQSVVVKSHAGSLSTDNDTRSQASSRSSCENQSAKEPLSHVTEMENTIQQNTKAPDVGHKPFPPVFSEAKHTAVSHTVSLDNTGQATPMRPLVQKVPHPIPVVHSSSLDSRSSNYDPSVLLFTPSQTMQIAIHKAAINKQLSQEEGRRQSVSSSRHGSFSKTCESEEVSTDGEEGGDEAEEECMSDESRHSETEDEVEEENTVLQITNGNTRYPAQATTHGTNMSNSEKEQVLSRTIENANFGSNNINSVAKPYAASGNYKSQENKSLQMINNVSNINRNSDNAIEKSTVVPRPIVPTDIKQEKYQNVNNPSTWTTDVAKHEFIYDQARNENGINMNAIIDDSPSFHNSSLHSNTKYPAAAFQNSVSHDISNVNSSSSNVSSAQRLLQLATADTKVPTRYRSDKKVKMKRANTIDIPKPLNFYEIEDESDYSSEDDNDYDDKHMGRNSSNSQHRAAYLALRGPIRVGTGNKYPGDNKVPPPSFQPKTESDRKFLAFLQQHGSGSNQASPAETFKVATYNPSARGGHHWSNRFSNIKTSFETSANKETNSVDRGAQVAYGPAAARLFWQSADDSATIVKARSSIAAANGPRLTRQGSQFLRKLFEQKDQEKQEQSKLPWTDKSVEENVVVGSLTVANTKGTPNSIYSKKQVFTPPPSPISQAPVKINKFSHAPMSAFRPVEKKSNQKLNDLSPDISPSTNQPWASPSASGNVKQLANQKFCTTQPSLTHSDILTNVTKNVKQRVGMPQETLSPVSPTLPWIKENPENRSLNSAVAKFENMSRETSPQPAPIPVSHSRSTEKIAVPQTLTIHKQADASTQKTYLPPPNAAGIVQGRLQENNIFPNMQHIKEPPAIPKTPSLISPSLSIAQTFDSKQSFTKQDFRKQEEIMKSHQEKYFNKEKNGVRETHSGKQPSALCQPTHGFQNSSNKSEKFGHHQQHYERPQFHPLTHTSPQTYSGSVTSRTAIYSSALGNKSSNVPAEKEEKPPVPPLSLPLKNIPQKLDSPDIPSPEAFTAVSHVMTGPVSHQAVTVSQKTRHRYDEEGEENKTSAARNLSSVLQFSMVKGDGENTNVLGVPKQNKSPSPDSRRDEPTNLPLNQKPGMIRNKSEPDMKVIENCQFAEYQSTKQGTINDGKAFGKGQHLNANVIPISTRLRPASAESLIMATSTEELQESGESVLTTRLQIPVYNNVSGKVPSHRANSLHDIVQDRKSPYENGSALQSPLHNSHVLHKSGSWHQLAPGQPSKPRRPQSLALPDLPTGNTGNTRRGHSGLSKAKSSHSLAFPKQFEAALAPDTIETKKSKVEAYLNTTNSKTSDPNIRISQNKSPNISSQKSALDQKHEVPLLDDSLDNVEEAFEDLFNATTGQSVKACKNSVTKTKTKKVNYSEQGHSIQQQYSASAAQFVNKQGIWEEPTSVRGSRSSNVPSHRLAVDNASK